MGKDGRGGKGGGESQTSLLKLYGVMMYLKKREGRGVIFYQRIDIALFEECEKAMGVVMSISHSTCIYVCVYTHTNILERLTIQLKVLGNKNI